MNFISLDFLPLDYIILAISLVIILFSFWKGFINSTLSLLTWVGSLFVTVYTYEIFSKIINEYLLSIEIFSNYDQFVYILSILFSIPVIFLISLFILKKIRRMISSDLDKSFIGLIFDKFFGAVYGIVFTYIILSTIIFFSNNNDIQIFYNINSFLKNNSLIFDEISKYNESLIERYFINLDNA